MKNTLLALVVAFSSTMAFAATDVVQNEVAHSTPSTHEATKQTKPAPRPEHRGEMKDRKPLTPEQFSEFKVKHLNMLKNRETVLKGETACAESAKNMDDLKVCFKSARDARKEIGSHRWGPHGKRGNGEHVQHHGLDKEKPMPVAVKASEVK